MKKRYAIVPIVLIMLFSCATNNRAAPDAGDIKQEQALSSAEYKSEYLRLLNDDKFDELFSLLNGWEKSYPEDPEMFIGFFNYYINRNISSGIALGQNPDQNDDFMTITDPETDEVVGYMYGETSYNTEDAGSAISWLNKGLKIAPDRLDMHFGKIHILQEINDFTSQSEALAECLYLSSENGNNWLWSDNEPVNDGFNYFINTIQDYYYFWLDTGSETSLDALRSVSEVQMSLYPEHVYAYNNIAFSYLVFGELDKGLPYLLKAEEISPEDVIILRNIGLCYRNMGNKEEAKSYFEKLLQYPDEIDTDEINSLIESL